MLLPYKVTFISVVQGRIIPLTHLTTGEFLDLHADKKVLPVLRGRRRRARAEQYGNPSEWLLTDLNCLQVSTPVVSYMDIYFQKIDERFDSVATSYVCYLNVLFFHFYKKRGKTFASFFVFLRFVVFTLLSDIGLDYKRQNWLKNWLKKSQAKSGRFIPSAPLCKFTRTGLTFDTFGKLSQRSTTPCQTLTRFLTAAALEMPAICCPLS